MENPEVANTSTKTEKKKKSKNKSSNESILHMEANVKPRRSFWRSLFKKQPKKIDDDTKETVITPKLNAIFEEPKNSDEKDTIQDEIEEFKQTLKQISPTILETDPPQSPPEAPTKASSQEGLLEFLSSTSSNSETSAASEKVTTEPNPSDAVKDKDAYSFEYSESSETSGEGQVEEKTQDKVKFVETVEQKDADSNIVVKDLNPGEDEAATGGESEPLSTEGLELNPGEDPSEDKMKIPAAVAEQPPNKVLQHKRSPEMLPNTDSDRKSLDEKSTGSQDSSDETEVWSERLNELSGLRKSVLPTAVDLNSLDETASGYREYRLDDFFKMVLQTNDEQIIKYSVAYDPIFANFNFEYLHPNLGENETFPSDDRQKVVRKRKMMSLLHDKNKMAEYLREIEQKENDEKTMDYMINLNNCTSLTAPQNSPKQKEINMQIPPENENVLYLLENTKQKLQKHIETNNHNIDPKILNLYSENYLSMFLELPNKKMEQSVPNIQEIKDNQPLTNDSQTGIPIDSNNMDKKFQNIEKEIDLLFKDLLTNITELKDACILNGCPVDESETKEPFITMKPIIETTIVKPILDEILNNIFHKDPMLKGNFNSKPLSFISDFGEFKNEPANLQISQPLHTFTVPKITLEQNLEQNEKILTALQDEMSEYNPVSYINSTEYTPVPSENSQNNSEPPNSSPVNQNLIEKQEISENLVENIIENAVQNIELDAKEVEKSKKFGLYHEKNKLDLPLTSRITNFNCNNPPDVTESLKHIFFGQEPDRSDFNLIEENSPKAGPSNQETDIPQLPSVPSTPLEGSNSGGSSAGRIITILDNKFSEGTEFSKIAFPDNLSYLDLNYNNASVSSDHKNDVELERKQPEINFFESKLTDGDTITKSIQDNLKIFQQNMVKINNTNQKTAEMLNNPSLLETPEGSLSILSTITENYLESAETTSKISKNSQNSQNSQNVDRYPKFIANPKDLTNPKPSDKNLKDNPDTTK